MTTLDAAAPLSYAQERLWFIDAATGGGLTYNVPLLLHWTEPIDLPALEIALATVVERHEVLRTTYALHDTGPVQVVHPPGPVPIEVLDAPGDRAAVHEAALRRGRDPFDLAAAPPIRCVVWRGGPDGDALLLNVHHIAIDGWSTGPLFAELAQAYADARAGRQPEPAPMSLRYRDFAARDRAASAEPAAAKHLHRRVDELVELDGDLALAGRRPARRDGDQPGHEHRFTVPTPVWARVLEFATEIRATPFVVLLTAFQAVLTRWTERSEFVLGMISANRTDPEFEKVVGFFVNTVPLRCRVPAGATFRELCAGVRRESFAALTHQRLPYEKVIAQARERGVDDLVTVAFAVQNMPAPDYPVPPPWTTPLVLPNGTAKYEVMLTFTEGGAGFVELAVDRYEPAVAQRLAENVTVLLAAALAGPDRPLAALPVTPRGIGTVLSGPSRRHAATTVLDLLTERFATVDPDAPAVSVLDETTTWRELDEWSNAIAAGMPEQPYVPVLAARGGGMAAAWLGVLRAGRTYVPLGVDTPPDRAEHILREVGASTVLADAAGAALLDRLTVAPKVIRIDERRAAAKVTPADPDPESPALLLFTSGTTGRPKGILVPHRGLLNTVLWWTAEFGLGPADRVLCTWSTQFDMASFDTFRCLTSGAHLVYADDVERRDPGALLAHLRGGPDAVTVASMTPSLARAMLAADRETGTNVRAVTMAGEALTHQLLRDCVDRWGVRVHNLYGPAEVSCASTGGFVDPDDRHPTIGRPLPNYRCHVLGREGEELPEGVPGELYLAGDGVGLGYLDQPGRTAAAFVPDPVAPGRRMYRTGDRVAARPDGRLDFLGRYDHQVKILGNRIEPDEVRALLEEHPAVRAAEVRSAGSPPRLVAWVTLSTEDLPARDELLAPLLGWLPAPALPTEVYAVAEIPRNGNDKTDFAALRSLRATPLPAATHDDETLTGDQRRAATIMAAVLGGDTALARDTNFFSAGGHSLRAVEVVRGAAQRFGAAITLRDFLAEPTVAGLGRLLAGAGDGPVPEVRADERHPATSTQQRLWFLDRTKALRKAYLVPVLVELAGTVDHQRLRDAVAAVLARHPALRSRFELDVARRRICYRTDGPAPEVAIADDPAGLTDFCWTPFDLAADAPARARVIRDGERTVLALVGHHIVLDGWSLDILMDQIGRAYRSGVDGLPAPVHPAVSATDPPPDAAEVIERLRGAPTDIALPLAKERTQVQPVDATVATATVDASLTAALRAVSAPLGCSTFVLGATLLAAALARRGEQREFLLAFPWSGRDRASTLHAVGMFVNTLVLRADLRDEPTWRALLTRIREQSKACYRTADVRFDEVVAALQPDRDLSRPPLTPVYLGVVDQERVLPDLGPGITARNLPLPGMTVKYELDLTVTDRGRDLQLTATYPTDLWAPTTVADLLSSVVTAAADLAADPDLSVLTGVRHG
ncbi:MAG TPA: amino acid adenylation domain-containing protein [Actinophytocola sp.]|nr:amino acid adenylation domain-containing protein [Actinophytocola sp.]